MLFFSFISILILCVCIVQMTDWSADTKYCIQKLLVITILTRLVVALIFSYKGVKGEV